MTPAMKRIVYTAFVVLGGLHIASAQSVRRIEISKLSYSPAEVTIHLGDTIEWANNDPIAHTATAKPSETGGAWEVLIAPGKTAKYVPTLTGTISYYCRFHPNMKGRFIVLLK
jgi:plastocyanin